MLDKEAENERFEEAVRIANGCAYECTLDNSFGRVLRGVGCPGPKIEIDCDICPCAGECREFWDTHVCNGVISIDEVRKKFEGFSEFKRRKNEIQGRR